MVLSLRHKCWNGESAQLRLFDPVVSSGGQNILHLQISTFWFGHQRSTVSHEFRIDICSLGAKMTQLRRLDIDIDDFFQLCGYFL